MKNTVYALFVATVIASCATSSKVSEEQPVEKTATVSADEAMHKGQKLFSQSCGKCHRLYQPSEYSQQEWEEILPVMFKKAKLEQTESDLIHQFISAGISK